MNSRSSDDQVSLRVAHLGMVQGVISRMSGFSATVKNFAITVCAAIVAIAFDKQTPALILSAMVAVALFLAMDAYYHLLEVRFRELYKATAMRPIDAGSDMLLEAPKATGSNRWKVLKSATLLPFYVLLLFALALALKVGGDAQHAKANAAATRDAASPSGQELPAAERVRRPIPAGPAH